jgi:hypothetical protein
MLLRARFVERMISHANLYVTEIYSEFVSKLGRAMTNLAAQEKLPARE